MIKYNLKCENKHEFESWFSDSNEFEKLSKKKLLERIYCSSKKIQKSIMSPMIVNTKLNEENIGDLDQKLINEKNKLIKLREYVEKMRSLLFLVEVFRLCCDRMSRCSMLLGSMHLLNTGG